MNKMAATRQPTSSLGLAKKFRLPNVQLIGAQKAGTSAIADWLFDEGGFGRPMIFDVEPSYYSKEVHFFDSEWRYQQGVEFYAKRFQSKSDWIMDATPDTLPFAERFRSIYEAAGGYQASTVKIIVILREPVSRELSLYNHLAFECRRLDVAQRSSWHNQVLKEDNTIMTFDEFVHQVSIPAFARETGPGRSSRHSLYASHLRKWFELFDRNQILVLSYDELQNRPDKLKERIQSFLGCTIVGKLRRSNSNDNEHKVSLPTEWARDRLLDVLLPYNQELYRLLETTQGPSMEEKPFPIFQLPPSFQ